MKLKYFPLILIFAVGFPTSEGLTDQEIDRIIAELDREDELANLEENLHNSLNVDQETPQPSEGTQIEVQLNPDDPPGHLGSPVVIESPTEQQAVLIKRGFERNEYNEYVSDLISIQRRLPDVRNKWCKEPGRYQNNLLPMSVIICFHNEGWSVLLRTIHSILDRTPDHLLTEILLVDDFSEFEHLKTKLENYVTTLYKVKLVRAPKRLGLIRARMLGASHADGPILTFMDSHVEVAEGWAEPLTDRITRSWTAVVAPVIDWIDMNTFEFRMTDRSIQFVGGFKWDLKPTKKLVRDDILTTLNTPADPVPSPTLIDGIFAIHKKFWKRIGQYEENEYDVHGAENLEFSIKTWMCGGTLEIIPCSHIGHILRPKSPYPLKVNPSSGVDQNARLAAVWMDDYAKNVIGATDNYGDISKRVALRKKLQCKSFSWYIKNIYPDIYDPSRAVAEGELRSEAFGGSNCLDAFAEPAYIGQQVKLWPCHEEGGNQFWLYTMFGELRRENLCLDYDSVDPKKIFMHECHSGKGNQLWKYDDDTGFVHHPFSNTCLTRMSRNPQRKHPLAMEPCEGRITQRWKFLKYNKHNEPEPELVESQVSLAQEESDF